jgi:hypothetical protein
LRGSGAGSGPALGPGFWRWVRAGVRPGGWWHVGEVEMVEACGCARERWEFGLCCDVRIAGAEQPA